MAGRAAAGPEFAQQTPEPSRRCPLRTFGVRGASRRRAIRSGSAVERNTGFERLVAVWELSNDRSCERVVEQCLSSLGRARATIGDGQVLAVLVRLRREIVLALVMTS